VFSESKNAGHGYRTNKGEITILCYADDTVIISENDDELQRLLYQFYLTAKRYNMWIAINKTKSLVVAKEPRRCKLAVYDEIVEQVMSFRYLGVEITSHQDRRSEVKTQIDKASRIAGCLKEVIWNNQFLKIEAKTRIYKSCGVCISEHFEECYSCTHF